MRVESWKDTSEVVHINKHEIKLRWGPTRKLIEQWAFGSKASFLEKINIEKSQ